MRACAPGTWLLVLASSAALAGEPAPSTAPVAPAQVTPPPAAPAAPRSFPRVGAKSYAERVLAPHQGKLVVVNFWGSFCAPCLVEIPTLTRVLAGPDAKKQNLALVFVAVDGPAIEPHVRSLIEKRKLAIDTFLVEDEDPAPLVQAVDPSWAGEVPYTVFYGPDGTRLFAVDGEQSEAELRAHLEKARAIAGAVKR